MHGMLFQWRSGGLVIVRELKIFVFTTFGTILLLFSSTIGHDFIRFNMLWFIRTRACLHIMHTFCLRKGTW